MDFASIARPLFPLTERSREFKWTSECSEAFSILKSRLTSAPILEFPDFKAVFVLDTDASESGIGAVLSQFDMEGGERVVAYASRVLNKAERKYSVTRKELLAVVTFIKQFRSYLLGRHFISEPTTTLYNGCTPSKNLRGKLLGGWRNCKNLILKWSIGVGGTMGMLTPFHVPDFHWKKMLILDTTTPADGRGYWPGVSSDAGRFETRIGINSELLSRDVAAD